jgi:hypothetical protein
MVLTDWTIPYESNFLYISYYCAADMHISGNKWVPVLNRMPIVLFSHVLPL